MKVSDKTLDALKAALDFREMRQEIISSNIANAETPGYKAKRLKFEDALARALDVDDQREMKTEDEAHYDVGNGGFKNLEPEVILDPNGVISESGNTVDEQDEMSRLVENKIMFDALVQLVNKKLALKKYAIESEK
jgi:flagellar basal-body rod protein FlgB